MIQGPIKLKNCSLEWLFQPSKTCKVWFMLDPSMCHSCFLQDIGKQYLFSLNIFFLPKLSDNFLENLFFLLCSFFFSRCLLHNSSSPFIVEFFWASWGTVGSPVLVFYKQSSFCLHHLGKSPFPFSLILSFSWFWFLWKPLVGHPLWGVLRYALLGILTSGVFFFSVSFLFGRNPVLLFWNRFC